MKSKLAIPELRTMCSPGSLLSDKVLVLDGKPVRGKIVEFTAHTDGFLRVTLEIPGVRFLSMMMDKPKRKRARRKV